MPMPSLYKRALHEAYTSYVSRRLQVANSWEESLGSHHFQRILPGCNIACFWAQYTYLHLAIKLSVYFRLTNLSRTNRALILLHKMCRLHWSNVLTCLEDRQQRKMDQGWGGDFGGSHWYAKWASIPRLALRGESARYLYSKWRRNRWGGSHVWAQPRSHFPRLV